MDEYLSQAAHYFNLVLNWLRGISTDNWIAFGLGLLVAWLFLKGKGGRGRSSHRRRYRGGFTNDNYDISKFTDMVYKPCPLMSPTEIRFWRVLYQAVPGYQIFPQVAINALVDVESENSEHFRQVLRAFNTFRADFIVCDANLRVLAIVELDDKSHDDRRVKDQRRDFVTTQAGYRTVRFDCRDWPTVERIKTAIFG